MNGEQFKEWLKREMPEGTVIGNPEWWAKKIWQAALCDNRTDALDASPTNTAKKHLTQSRPSEIEREVKE